MSATDITGARVAYDGDLPCDEAAHHGTVTAVKPDASGGQIITVEFDCGITQDIPASELWLGVPAIADLAVVKPQTWTAYVNRGQAPPHSRRNPDTGRREWTAEVIGRWLATRPGAGARTDTYQERQAFSQAGLWVLAGGRYDDSYEAAAERYIRSADRHEITGVRGERFEWSFDYDDIPRIVAEAKTIEDAR